MDQVARFSDSDKSSKDQTANDAEYKKRLKELQEYQGEQ